MSDGRREQFGSDLVFGQRWPGLTLREDALDVDSGPVGARDNADVESEPRIKLAVVRLVVIFGNLLSIPDYAPPANSTVLALTVGLSKGKFITLAAGAM